MSIDWMSRAQAMRDDLIAHRRDFHRHPELAFQEVRTAEIVARELHELGLEVSTGIGKTGVVGVLDGQQDGPTVMVRCDMDALPVTEANNTDYSSEMPGKMHACGHDGHTAIGLGVARMLVEQRDKIAGRIKFVFQPAEEIASGARAMIEDGVLENPSPEVCLGLHLWNDKPFGVVALTEGPSMAGSDHWSLTIKGSGGHGALPEQTRDPIVAAAQIVNALQTVVSRNVSGLDTAVLSVTTFHAGDAMNVIPPEAKLSGTFRTYRPETHDLVERRLREISTGIAQAMQCEAILETKPSTPPLVNDPEVLKRLHGSFGRINAPRPLEFINDERTMGAEDMAIFLQKMPGVYMFVGSADHDRELDYPHHHPRFDFNEDALPVGAGLLAAAVASYVVPE
jgi:amidohydrolase